MVNFKRLVSKRRLICLGVCFVMLFMVLCVMHKLLLGNENWLYNSIIWSVNYIIALFLKPVIHKEDDIVNKIISTTFIIFVLFIVLAFVVGVIFDINRWWKVTIDAVVPWLVALIMPSNSFYFEDDKKTDNADNDKININVKNM